MKQQSPTLNIQQVALVVFLVITVVRTITLHQLVLIDDGGGHHQYYSSLASGSAGRLLYLSTIMEMDNEEEEERAGGNTMIDDVRRRRSDTNEEDAPSTKNDNSGIINTLFIQEIAENNFEGVMARPYEPWRRGYSSSNSSSSPNLELPCFASDKNMHSFEKQNNGYARTGFMFMRPLKCGSTSTIGIVLRFAHNIAKRKRNKRLQQSQAQQQQVHNNNHTSIIRGRKLLGHADGAAGKNKRIRIPPLSSPIFANTGNGKNNKNNNPLTTTTSEAEVDIDMCKVRYTHGFGNPPHAQRFYNREKTKSFLFTLLRDPSQRIVSTYNFFEIARHRLTPTDTHFRNWLNHTSRGIEATSDYYLNWLSTTPYNNPNRNEPVALEAANNLLHEYNFIGITERFDESAVVLMMLLDIPMSDILYLSSTKQSNGFDYAWKRCLYIFPPYVSPRMNSYFKSQQWHTIIKYDAALYRAANRSLDLTIDKVLGRTKFELNLQKYLYALRVVREKCGGAAAATAEHDDITLYSRCTDGGELISQTQSNCLWDNTGCGMDCLDQVAIELNLL